MPESRSGVMILYELINPSDPYTFYAPSAEIAAATVLQLSPTYGATPAHGDGPSTPVLFGWEPWLEEHGVDRSFVETHAAEIAEALDSFLIGDAHRRADVEAMLELLPAEQRRRWRDERQDRQRSSLSQIGELAYKAARRIRELHGLSNFQMLEYQRQLNHR